MEGFLVWVENRVTHRVSCEIRCALLRGQGSATCHYVESLTCPVALRAIQLLLAGRACRQAFGSLRVSLPAAEALI